VIVLILGFYPSSFLATRQMKQRGDTVFGLEKQIIVSIFTYGRLRFVSRPYYLHTSRFLFRGDGLAENFVYTAQQLVTCSVAYVFSSPPKSACNTAAGFECCPFYSVFRPTWTAWEPPKECPVTCTFSLPYFFALFLYAFSAPRNLPLRYSSIPLKI